MQAFAKINLFLDVLGKRADGYHDIFSVMQSVDLCDDLAISIAEENEFFCDDGNVPTGGDNLVVKAVNALAARYGFEEKFKIELVKRIPMGAGLAGGSSDCAATLLGVNELLGFKIPSDELLEIGKSLGADVPFCMVGGTAITEGIGERISPLPPHPPCYIVIACPEINVSTAEIFSRLGNFQNSTDRKISSVENVNKFLQAYENKDLRGMAASFYNVFTAVTAGLHPEIKELIASFREAGAVGAEMSGTGSSVFAYFDDEKAAEKALNISKNTFLCKPVQP
ncbi:MAG: 4-(cytidine 5'-diphospho)-2-C-methyl-D-erythritol kinase [Defluviitaleaceae bacterium]|nr:4-(cytidine 5'-diphospho)-2-C-methyl-D-erythritol kinase [Defluviitaleaceae bacterium]